MRCLRSHLHLCLAPLSSALSRRCRFNLSEFSHPSKFNRLTGGDPNYVGYKEGGELTNFVRNAEERRASRLSGITHTSCVLLLDEVGLPARPPTVRPPRAHHAPHASAAWPPTRRSTELPTGC